MNEKMEQVINSYREQKDDIIASIVADYPDFNNMGTLMDEFFDLILESLEGKESLTEENAKEFGGSLGVLGLRKMELHEGLTEIYRVRTKLREAMTEIMIDQSLDLCTAITLGKKFDEVHDLVVQYYSAAYISSYKERLDKKQEEFLVLSAPVVPILEGMAILPIIGDIDEARAERLMQNALREASQRELDYLFIDLSGVPYIDTMIAYHIFKVVDSLSLIGVNAVLAGIRPEVSQTMVSLGVRFEEIRTYNTLQQAFIAHTKGKL